MENQTKPTSRIRYIKPEVIDLGDVITIKGGSTCVAGGSPQSCFNSGNSAGDCDTGISAACSSGLNIYG